MRVAEVFGPTIQGEGPWAGTVATFLRLGGCDYRCAWCDTPYAVDPTQVRDMPDCDDAEVVAMLARLPFAPMLVISGGNPALWDLSGLLPSARLLFDRIAVETQGSVWKEWLRQVDSLVVSPKPPSSGEATARNLARLDGFLLHAEGHAGLVLKIVVFDGRDLEWARSIHQRHPGTPFYLSTGTVAEEDLTETAARYRWLCEAVTGDCDLHAAVVLPQLHVVAWGHRVGV
jgi:7-carboxy-7-deazaguanine synthase